MSWLYSQALVAEYLEDTCSDGAPFAPSNGNPTPQAYLPPDKMTAFSRPSRFGMTFAPLTDDRGEELLTWYLGASRARTSASQGPGKALMVNAPAYGLKWPASSMRYDRDSHSWRTAQHSLLGGLDEYSETWPRWGLMLDGECWARPTLVHLTSESASGLLPTLLRPNGGRTVAHVTDWRGKTAYHNGKKVQVDLRATLKRLPTLTVCGNYNRKGASATSGDGLATALRNGETESTNNGPLNPPWCEWYMGFPEGWTELVPLETHKSRNAQRRHGGF